MLNTLAAIEAPVPDIVIVALAAALLISLARIGSQRQKREIERIQDVYQSELTRVTRGLNTAESRLKRTKGEMERLRRASRKSKAARKRI
ncbi:MAG: hypothetical protein AAGA19_03800 [Pseudomonadota bacterium]